VCGRTFSARRGIPLFGLKASEETFYDVIACLAEGNGIRATARIKGVDKDTVAQEYCYCIRWKKNEEDRHLRHMG
jgi:transposase-like protein